MTLAPERVPPGFIRFLADAGLRVALGHSMATYEETSSAIAEGLTGFTHLFNAMRPMTAREPGPIAAALECQSCWYGLIVDGDHVAPAMLRLALRGLGTPMLVTDAMPPVGGTKGRVHASGARDCGSPAAASRRRKAGSRAPPSIWRRRFAIAVRLLGVPLTDALRMASRAPAEFLGLGDRLGRLAPGYRADMVAFDPADIRVLGTWVAGRQIP